MKILVRADANQEIGTGHIMRCAALCSRLKIKGAQIHFICSGLPDSLAKWLIQSGFNLSSIPNLNNFEWRSDLENSRNIVEKIGKIDLLIVDHYKLGIDWEKGMRSFVTRIMVVDDLADRDHDCDFLLDQNLHENSEKRYKHRIPNHAIQFLGPQYALLRMEFDEPGLIRERDGSVRNLFVFLGGTDPGNQTLKVIDALKELRDFFKDCTIVLGNTNNNYDLIQKTAINIPNLKILKSSDKISILMAKADLAIGTCGIAAWERCAIGLPSLVTITAENQRDDAEILHKLGVVENLGDASKLDSNRWKIEISKALNDPVKIRRMSNASSKVMMGRRDSFSKLERTITNASL